MVILIDTNVALDFLTYIDNINQDKEMWKDNDDLKDYQGGFWDGDN